MTTALKPCILYYEVLHYQHANRALLEEIFRVTTLPDPDHDRPEILSEIDALLAPLGFQCGPQKIDRCPKLKVIGSNTTSEPHIDRPYAESKGVKVVTLMGDTAFLDSITPTAEHTFGLILGLIRHVPWAYRSVLDGRWSRWDFGGERMLSRMGLGIVGLGRIGRMVAKCGRAFGMDVHYFDPYVPEGDREGLSRVRSLKDLLRLSDIVTLHVPLNAETTGMIKKETFECFRPGAYLINTARAEVVDREGLLWALESERLGGAALDVLDGEFMKGFAPSGHPLVHYAETHENLLITPHIGGSTKDAWGLTEERMIRRMHLALKGGEEEGKA